MTKLREFSFDSRCLDLARLFFPDYSEQVLCLIPQEVQDVIESNSLEHSWNCPGEECRYRKAGLVDRARDFKPIDGAVR